MDFDRELDEIPVNLSHYLTENTTPRSYLHRICYSICIWVRLMPDSITGLLMTEKALFKKGILKLNKQHYRGQ